MKLNDKRTTSFPVDFDSENTLIWGTSETICTHALPELLKLGAKGNTVYVTDPYLFPKPANPSYIADLKLLLKKLEAKTIVYCANSIQNGSLFQDVVNDLASANCTLKHENFSHCHDRFWYCKETEKCVSFGTSLNGIGGKICRVSELDSMEVQELKKEFQAQNIFG